MNWTAAAALGTWTAVVGGVLYLVVRLTITVTVDEAIKKLNGTYVRSGGTKITGDEMVRRIEALES